MDYGGFFEDKGVNEGGFVVFIFFCYFENFIFFNVKGNFINGFDEVYWSFVVDFKVFNVKNCCYLLFFLSFGLNIFFILRLMKNSVVMIKVMMSFGGMNYYYCLNWRVL